MKDAPQQSTYDVIVIGGGAAGMMAAGRAAERGRSVLLLEKNPVLGKKLALTGGGRCNITNAEEDIQRFLTYYGNAKKFLHSPFSQFGVKETFSFFTAHGLPLKVEARNRVFPVTEHASDVVKTMQQYLRDGQITVRTRSVVKGFVVEDDAIGGVRVDDQTLTATSYILATGGASHPATGSTGDGFRWLKDIGHTVAQPTPAVVPLAVRESWIHGLAGTSLDGVKVTFFVDDVKKLTLKGRVLCTHFGLSDPLILNAAADVAELLQEGEVTGAIDTQPTLDVGAVDRLLTTTFDQNKNKSLVNVLKHVVPTGTAAAILSLIPTIVPETKAHSVTKVERKALAGLLKQLPFTVTGLMGLDRAVIVDGGLSLDEIDSRAMRSRKFQNLYVTGDLLHINRPSGGFSLQLCWTSGWVAGNSV